MRLDLLEPRRRQLGVPEDRLLPVAPLLRRGGLVGLALLAVPLVLALALLWRQQWLEARITEVRPMAERSAAIRSEAEGLRRRQRSLQAANRKLTNALLAVRSSSALLTELAALTPLGVQLTASSVTPTSLELEGVAYDPNAFIRLNALQLALQQASFAQPGGVTLRQALRQQRSDLISFRVAADLRPDAPTPTTEALRALGAEGMARRVELLRQEGLIR
ncbi:MAG: PilN domain-containing protein [Prochlorococcaceae cyanobacterium]|jgi:type IV pilus assembly protein PilN